MIWNKFVKILMVMPLVTLLFSSCGSSGSNEGAGNVTPPESTGTLTIDMTDASTDQYQAVYVTVQEIQAHKSADESESGWLSVGTPNKTYNLLNLVNGVRESLGITELSAGHYTQLRLILAETPDSSTNILSESHPFANYVIDLEGTAHELKVPSGMQSGIKIVHGFDVNENSTTELLLDFDASASVVIAGHSGKYLLKPTIKVLDTVEAAIISGTVTKSADDSALASTLVSAQIFDDSASDIKDRVTVQTSTIADEEGGFALFLAAGTYNIVFYKEGYQAAVHKITVTAGDTPTQDAALDTSATGTASGTVGLSDTEAYASLSFRQSVMIDENSEKIELFSLNVADGGSYLATLPEGDVTVVSSSFDETTESEAVTINADADTELNVSL